MAERDRPRIIFIGFNKCGTTSLHKLVEGSGYASMHWRNRRHGLLANRIFTNFSLGRPLLTGLEAYDAFSELSLVLDDLYLEANALYPILQAENPDAYFVLNTRDRENWIRSRENHVGAPGGMLERMQKAAGCQGEDLRALWRAQWDAHHASAPAYFAGTETRFLTFDIERDPITAFISFVAADYSLDPAKWEQHNRGTRP